MKPTLIFAALACSATPLLAQKWTMQFFHDEDRSAMSFTDLKFLTPKFGIASGILSKPDARPQGVFLVTNNGGETWETRTFGEIPMAMQFINDSMGFLVTNKGVWKTEERGLSWKKLKSEQGLRHVYFVSPETGFAVGDTKQFIATFDGGKTWQKPEALKKSTSNPNYTVFNWIAFVNKERGIVVGGAQPPRKRGLPVPAWVDPEAAQAEREWPTLTITFETKDGGKTWDMQTAPVFGHASRLTFFSDNSLYGLSIMRYERAFDYPSELYLFNWRNGKSESVYRAKQRTITDARFTGPTEAMIATIERPGSMSGSPLPGKLRILSASDLRSWTDMAVDYRASGKNAILSVIDKQNAWVALDSGMILRLKP